MKDKEFKPTDGECIIFPLARTYSIMFPNLLDSIAHVYKTPVESIGRSNAELIRDSFNTYSQTKMLPSQMAKENNNLSLEVHQLKTGLHKTLKKYDSVKQQNEALKEALKAFIGIYKTNGRVKSQIGESWINQAEKALSGDSLKESGVGTKE